jgi:hypothetical protein
MDMLDGIIVGAAAAAIGAIVAQKFLEQKSVGGASPVQPVYGAAANYGRPQPLYVLELAPTPMNAAPVAQTNPNQEAAVNQFPVEYVNAFGQVVNQPADGGTILPA